LIERSGKDLREGFWVGDYNHRSFRARPLGEGGNQERTAADRYRSDAERIGARWPKTGALLRELARDLDRDARREDEQADRRRDR
jgi:hypothetical protein